MPYNIKTCDTLLVPSVLSVDKNAINLHFPFGHLLYLCVTVQCSCYYATTPQLRGSVSCHTPCHTPCITVHRLFIHISITVYHNVLIYTMKQHGVNETTQASKQQQGFEPTRVLSTTPQCPTSVLSIACLMFYPQHHHAPLVFYPQHHHAPLVFYPQHHHSPLVFYQQHHHAQLVFKWIIRIIKFEPTSVLSTMPN